MSNLRAHLQLSRNGSDLGKIVVDLYGAAYPNTVRAFVGVLQMHLLPDDAKARQEESIGEPLPPPMRGSRINRINAGESVEFGTSATNSFFGGMFPDEPIADTSLASQVVHKFGSLSMSNIGPDTNASNYFLCLLDESSAKNQGALKSLNKNHVVFGGISNANSLSLLRDLSEQVKVSRNNAPVEAITISEVAVEQVAPALDGSKPLTKRERRMAELREKIAAKQESRAAGALKRLTRGDPADDGFGEEDYPEVEDEDARPTKRRRLEPKAAGPTTINTYADATNKEKFGASGRVPQRSTLAGTGVGTVGLKSNSFGGGQKQNSGFNLFAAQQANFASDLKDIGSVQRDRRKKREKRY